MGIHKRRTDTDISIILVYVHTGGDRQGDEVFRRREHLARLYGDPDPALPRHGHQRDAETPHLARRHLTRLREGDLARIWHRERAG